MTNNTEGAKPTAAPDIALEQSVGSVEFDGLVNDRYTHYRSLPWDRVAIPNPRAPKISVLTKARRGYLSRCVGAFAVAAGATFPFFVDGRSALAGLAAAVTVDVSTRIAGRRDRAKTITTMRDDIAQAFTDFEDAKTALLEAHSDTKTLLALTWFEPRLDDARIVLTDPEALAGVCDKAADEVLAIGARAWALAQVEARRAQVIEAAVSPAVDAIEVAVEEEGPDFAEIESLAAAIVDETGTLAAHMGVEVPVLSGRDQSHSAEVVDTRTREAECQCQVCGALDAHAVYGDVAACRPCGKEIESGYGKHSATCRLETSLFAEHAPAARAIAAAHGQVESCFSCEGSGLDPKHYCSCFSCGGTGRATAGHDRPLRACSNCSGKGSVFSTQWMAVVVCPACDDYDNDPYY